MFFNELDVMINCVEFNCDKMASINENGVEVPHTNYERHIFEIKLSAYTKLALFCYLILCTDTIIRTNEINLVVSLVLFLNFETIAQNTMGVIKIKQLGIPFHLKPFIINPEFAILTCKFEK